MIAFEDIDINTKKDNIIDGIMKSKGLYCFVSHAKVGKSILSLQLIDCFVNGKQFLGHDIMPSPVLYISTEAVASQIKERAILMNLSIPKNTLKIIDRTEHGKISIHNFIVDIQEFVTELNGKVLIIDMLKDVDLGVDYDINSYQDVGQKLLPKLHELCEKYNLTIIFTHHLNKQGTTLGSTAFDAVVDGKLTLIESKTDKSLIRLNIINRDFPEQNIYLKKTNNLTFKVVNPFEEEENPLLTMIAKFFIIQGKCEMSCKDIIKYSNINITAKKLGKVLRQNLEYFKSEGIKIDFKRTSTERIIIAEYKELIDDE